MRHSFNILASLLSLAVACTKPYAEITEDTLDVSVPSSTKVHLDGLNTCWDKGDELTVFYKSDIAEKWTFKGNTGDISGTFAHESIVREENSQLIHAVYPYDAGATLENGTIQTSIPAEQVYRKNSFGTALLAGYTDMGPLMLNYCSAIVELKYRGPAEISHIILNGNDSEKIAGKCSVTFDGENTDVSCDGTSAVTLTCNTSLKDSSAESFYFSIAPGTFRKGLTFTVYFKGSGSQKVQVTEDISVSSGHIYTVEAGASAMPYEQKIINLLFSDGTTRNSPFTEEISFKYGKEIGPYYYKVGDEKYPFYMLCQNDNGDKNFRITNGGGLYIGGTPGDYIKFPAIKGYRLQDIAVSIHKSASDFYIAQTSTPEQPLTGGRCTGAESGDFRMLYLSDTKENTSYSMIMMDKVCCFRFITLYYRK